MRPSINTSQNYTKPIPSSIRSDAISVRSRNSNNLASTIRPFTARSVQQSTNAGKHAISLPSEDVKLAKRPVTAVGGLGGLYKKRNDNNSFHQKRQIKDASYFLSLLQTKEKAITSEIHKLNDEIQLLQMQNDKESIEATYQDLLKEVRDLEGLLADHNIVNDKIRHGCDPEELKSRNIELEMNNDQLACELDEIFISRQQCEKDISLIEQDIDKLHKNIKHRFQDADPATISEYQRSIKQIHDLHAEGKDIEMELEKMRVNYQKLALMASNDENYQRSKLFIREEEKIKKLRLDIVEIDGELFVAKMDPEDAHKYLLNEVKSFQAKLHDLKTEENKLNDEIGKERSKQLNIQNQVDEVEIEKYIANAKETVSKLWMDNKKKQKDIFDIVEYLNRYAKVYSDLKPTEEGLKKLSDDVDFRAKHLANSEQTMKRLLDQKEMRLKEVEIVENLETKIQLEMKELESSMETMQIEISKFTDLRNLQDVSEITTVYLNQMKERYIQRCNFMKSGVKAVSSRYEENKSNLNRSKTWRSLLDLEEKIRRHGQVIYTLQKNVAAKARQSEYESMKNECLELMNSMVGQ